MIYYKFNIVMVDDERDFLDSYKAGLQDEFQVQTFTRSEDAFNFVLNNPVDALILDYHMPEFCAKSTLSDLRKRDFNNPVLFLTGESDVRVKLESLELGIDDYLQKPITMTELSAYLRNRIKNFRRRNPELIKVKNLTMNLRDPQVYVNENAVMLTNKEFEILRLLVTNQNSVVSKNAILNKVWSNVAVEKNNIDTHMSNLRKKLEGFGCQIKTIKKIGYVLRV